MKPAILLPDGVGVRNFVLGPFLGLLAQRSGGVILHPIPEASLAEYAAPHNGRYDWRRLSPYRETPLAATLRYALAHAQMVWADTVSMRHLRAAAILGTPRRKLMLRTARLLGRSLAFPGGIRWLDRRHCREVRRAPQVESYRRQFQEAAVSIVFCSHQRPLEVLPPTLAARSLGIPTATFIFSWDNLTSKGRIAAPFDHYFVWSELMRQELLRYYPDVAAHRVHVVGTPQFDPYADESLLWSREEFFGRLGADPRRPLICYSGGDVGTCPEDHLHAGVLMELARSGRIQGSAQVLVRPAPVDDGSRYQPLRQRYPEMIFAQPAWVHTDPGLWAKCIPKAQDVRFLANLTRHADVNVNVASTMTLDFALHGRPVVNIGFDIADPPPLGRPPLAEYYYRFDHYRPVVELGAARLAHSAAELAEHVNGYLRDPGLDQQARRRFVDLEVGVAVGQSSAAVVDTLSRLSR
jgi:hypothetical protein